MNLSDAQITTTLIARDMDTTKAFYTEKLDLKMSTDKREDPGLFLEAGNGTKIYIYQSELPIPQNTVTSFQVDDVLTTVNELKAKGVKFETYDMEYIKTDENNIAKLGEMQVAWFKDPSGNILAIGNM